MAFSIIGIRSVEADLSHASVVHGGEWFSAMIPESLERLESLAETFQAELGYDAVLKYEVGYPKMDSESGIFATDDPAVVLVDGSVFNLVKVDVSRTLVDIYIQNGPEFLCVRSEELDDAIPETGCRIRLWLMGLKMYPTFT